MWVTCRQLTKAYTHYIPSLWCPTHQKKGTMKQGETKHYHQQNLCAVPTGVQLCWLLYVKNSFFFTKLHIHFFGTTEQWPPNVWSIGYVHCGSAQTYLISRLHEDVIGDFPKGQPQVNDVILSAASFWEIADVHHTASTCLPLCELMGTESSQWLVFKRHFPLAL